VESINALVHQSETFDLAKKPEKPEGRVGDQKTPQRGIQDFRSGGRIQVVRDLESTFVIASSTMSVHQPVLRRQFASRLYMHSRVRVDPGRKTHERVFPVRAFGASSERPSFAPRETSFQFASPAVPHVTHRFAR